jgi:hypothetical protein
MGTLNPFPQSADVAEAGGAYVRRAFEFNGRKLKSGDRLTREELESIPEANLTALVNTKHLQLWPASPDTLFIAEKFVVSAGHNKYKVIEGRLLTQRPVSKAHALKLAGKG